MTRRIVMLVFGIVLGAVSLAGCAFDAGGYHVIVTPTSSTAPGTPPATCVTDPATGRVQCRWN